MTSRTASTALLASDFCRSARLATWSTNSDFVTLELLLDEVRGRTTLSAVTDGTSRNPACSRRFSARRNAETHSVRIHADGTAGECGGPVGRLHPGRRG